MGSYNASKHGARDLSLNIRPLVADRGMSVNMLAPWIQETPLSTNLLKMFEAVGVTWADINDFLKIAFRVADDHSINCLLLVLASCFDKY